MDPNINNANPPAFDPNTGERITKDLNFFPGGPEGGGFVESVTNNTEASPTQESATTNEKAPEKLTTLEATPKPQGQQNPQNTQQLTPAPKTEKVQQAHFVDKTKEVTHLHHLEHVIDSITSIADKEEEEFITEVEATHGHK